MASYPGAKVHRSSRRQLGRGQHVQQPPATLTMTSTADTATLTFSVPVIVNGLIPLVVTGAVAFVSQTVVSPTVVHILYNGALTTLPWALAAGDPSIATFQGGTCPGGSGTFS